MPISRRKGKQIIVACIVLFIFGGTHLELKGRMKIINFSNDISIEEKLVKEDLVNNLWNEKIYWINPITF